MLRAISNDETVTVGLSVQLFSVSLLSSCVLIFAVHVLYFLFYFGNCYLVLHLFFICGPVLAPDTPESVYFLFSLVLFFLCVSVALIIFCG